MVDINTDKNVLLLLLLLFLLSLIVEDFETTQINQNYKSIDSKTKTTHNSC